MESKSSSCHMPILFFSKIYKKIPHNYQFNVCMKCSNLDVVRLPWSSLVDPVTSLARGGFSVTKSMGKSEWNCTFYFCEREFYWKLALSRFLWHLDDLFKSGKLKTSDLSPHLQKYFVKDGSFVKLGMKVTRPDMADILQEISEKGSLALYNGKYTKEITDVVSVYNTVLLD